MVPSKENRSLPRLLLIDDDPVSREVLAMILAMHGFPVESAEDGADALRLLDTSATLPEVILIDTQMPGLSGIELLNALRQRSDARLIAISGSPVSKEIRRATDGFLLKPIQSEDLVALLNTPKRKKKAVTAPETEATSESTQLTDWIDPVILGKLKAMMPAPAVLEIYSAVASDMEGRLVKLKAAMDARDSTEVAGIAHTIKGGCSMVGLTAATQAAARLESSNGRETWPKELLQLHFALSKLQGMLGDGLP